MSYEPTAKDLEIVYVFQSYRRSCVNPQEWIEHTRHQVSRFPAKSTRMIAAKIADGLMKLTEYGIKVEFLGILNIHDPDKEIVPMNPFTLTIERVPIAY